MLSKVYYLFPYDGTTDATIVEQEVIYIFLTLDGASVNNGLKSGLITLLKLDFALVSFVWIFFP